MANLFAEKNFSPTTPAVKVEQLTESSLSLPPPSSGATHPKEENPEHPNPNTTATNSLALPANLIGSLTQLCNLSTALSAFQCRFDELQKHLDYIQTAINSKLPLHLQKIDPQPSPLIQLPPITLPETLSSDPTKPSVPEFANSEQKPYTNDDKSEMSELQKFCSTMNARELRRYLMSHPINTLRKDVPEALKLANNPSKLVLDCFGRFYLQGSKAYTKNSPMIAGREISIFVLECFLLMGTDGVEIDDSVKEEAQSAAIAWKKRLHTEGGLPEASEIDARGLLLLIGCFGIPRSFTNSCIRDLLRASNPIGIADVLRKSNFLLEKIPELIEWGVKTKMGVEVVNIAYIFGVEDKFSPRMILESFLQDSEETWNQTRKSAKGRALVEANKKQLANLKSVIKCLENHKIDPSTFLPGWKFNDKIRNLEVEISDVNTTNKKKIEEKKNHPKRKSDSTETPPLKKKKTQEPKRSRFISHGFQEPKPSSVNVQHPNARINSYSASPSVHYMPGVTPLLADNLPGPVASRGVLSAGPSGPYGGIPGDYGPRLGHHGFSGQPSSVSSGLNGFNGPIIQSFEGFAGLQHNNPPLVSRSSGSDLYGFADAVLETEYRKGGSHTGGRNSSYLY